MQRIAFLTLVLALATSLVSCSKASPAQLPDAIVTSTSESRTAAVASGTYRNLFKEYLGKSDQEIQARLDAAWNQLFYGSDESERVYYPVGADMAYIMDIGNGDVRSEGMSYGMMIA